MTTTDVTTPSTEEEAVCDVLRRAMKAWTDNDPDGFADCYAEDGTAVLAAGNHHTSRAEIRDYMARGFEGPLKGSIGVDEQESVRILGDDTAVVISQSGYRLPDEHEMSPERLRRATWVLAKEDTGWVVKAYHNCRMS